MVNRISKEVDLISDTEKNIELLKKSTDKKARNIINVLEQQKI